jgi:type II secretory pathway pseudopilin PulG
MPLHKTSEDRKPWGFSLLESLLSLALFAILFLAGLAFFNTIRNHFHSLQEAYESEESLQAAADKIKLDLEAAGLGLFAPMSRNLVQGIESSGESLVIHSLECAVRPSADLQPGQTRISVADSTEFRSGLTLCIIDRNRGECHLVGSVGRGFIILEDPLQNGYAAGITDLLLIRRVIYFLDRADLILRRKVNTSSAQPLLEDAADFEWDYDGTTHLTVISLRIHSPKEMSHELCIRPKNLALADIGRDSH